MFWNSWNYQKKYKIPTPTSVSTEVVYSDDRAYLEAQICLPHYRRLYALFIFFSSEIVYGLFKTLLSTIGIVYLGLIRNQIFL